MSNSNKSEWLISSSRCAINANNANFGSVITSIATVKFVNQVADPTVGGVIFQHYYQNAGNIHVPEYDGRIVMPPGTTFFIRLANNGAANVLLSLSIGFWETSI
jgi:hypothetical protein